MTVHLLWLLLQYLTNVGAEFQHVAQKWHHFTRFYSYSRARSFIDQQMAVMTTARHSRLWCAVWSTDLYQITLDQISYRSLTEQPPDSQIWDYLFEVMALFFSQHFPPKNDISLRLNNSVQRTDEMSMTEAHRFTTHAHTVTSGFCVLVARGLRLLTVRARDDTRQTYWSRDIQHLLCNPGHDMPHLCTCPVPSVLKLGYRESSRPRLH